MADEIHVMDQNTVSPKNATESVSDSPIESTHKIGTATNDGDMENRKTTTKNECKNAKTNK